MDNYSKTQKTEEFINDKFDNLDRDNLPTANIMVAGITGTGKSTLINAVFSSELAETGKGRPVTSHIAEYESNDVPIRIWDTVGLELDSEKTKESIFSIKQTIANKAESNNQFDRVHAIWYCINSGSSRYQGAELEFIKNLHSIGVPFVIVLTQCIGEIDEIDAFEKQIHDINEKMGMPDIDVVQVCAKDFKLRGITIEAFGLEDLVNITLDKLPEFIKDGFVAAQRVSKVQKRECCEKIIFEYVDIAQKGFWDKVPIINVFTTDSKITKMFTKIGHLYNTMISENEVEKLIKEIGVIDIPNGFWGLISPFTSKKYEKRIDSLFRQKKEEGFNVQNEKLDKSERVSRMLAFYGYNFLDAMEEVWEIATEEQLKNMEFLLDNLKGRLQRKFSKNNKPQNK